MRGAAIVTGAAGGIGKAICRRLGEDGFHVVAVDLVAELDSVVADLEADGLAATPVVADLISVDGRALVADSVAGTGLPLTALINNAGITRDARLVNLSEDDFAAVIEVNLAAPYELSRMLVPTMAAGSIVNISSRSYLGSFGQFNYAMSKGGLVGLTRALALQAAPAVRVNAVAPGLIATEMSMAIPEEQLSKMIGSIPLGRMGDPSEVADLVGFLCSEKSSYLTGEVIVIGGGRSLAQ
ncbi:MAG TPA: SDR family oxidoreductase [Acidimicrobiia bacterium]